VKPFKWKQFICRDEASFTPKEDDTASAAFARFVEYDSRSVKDENFFMDADHREQREKLLEAAIEAGSWKARYFDSVWTFRSSRYTKVGDSKDKAFARIVKLAGEGIPLVAYKLGSYYGLQNDNMYFWFDAAIDRGSVHAMSAVGSTIVVQSKDLRPIGKLMLECAVSKNHAYAYKSLGILADMEGRRLDAYRLWIKGVNEGCKECMMHVESLAKTLNDNSSGSIINSIFGRPSSSRLDENPLSKNTTPELELIKKFYSNNWSYEISELSDFALHLPEQMAFNPSDDILLRTLEREGRQRAEENKRIDERQRQFRQMQGAAQ
jgi:hypothetical protein